MSKYDKLKETLSADLRFMQPNARVPSRHSLCLKYKLSRATVDKALKELIVEGVLYASGERYLWSHSEQRKQQTAALSVGVWLYLTSWMISARFSYGESKILHRSYH